MALISCPDCEKEVSDRAPTCPNCGAPIATAPKAAGPGEATPYTDQEVAVLLSRKKKTNHVLHLLLSIVTAGLWLIVWAVVTNNNNAENSRVDRQIAAGKASNALIDPVERAAKEQGLM